MLLLGIVASLFYGCETTPSTSPSQTEEPIPAAETVETPSTDTLPIPETVLVLNTEDWIDYEEGIQPKNGKLTPIDQAELNSSFAAFRAQLLAAVEKKEVDFLLKHVDDQIKIGFGAEYGKEDFIKSWNLDKDPENSLVWQKLKEVLNLGGIFTNETLTSFTAPYTFHVSVDDPYGYKVITGTQVRVRAEPRLQGSVLGSLNYDVVQSADLNPGELPVLDTLNNEVHSWEKIRTPQGNVGYVYGKFVRSPIDFRANFKQQADTWKMMFFLAGD